MAATFTPQGGVAVTYVFRDKSQNRGFCSLYLPASVTIANARTAATELGLLLEAGSDAQIQGYSINTRSVASGAAAAVAGGNVEQKGKFTFLTAAGKASVFSIPAPKVSMMTSNERAMNVGDASTVDAIIDLFINGDTANSTEPVDSNGSDLTALIETIVKHRASTVG